MDRVAKWVPVFLYPGSVTLRITALLVFSTAIAVLAQDLGPKSEPAAMSSNYNPLVWRGDDAQFAVNAEHNSFCQAQFDREVASKSTNDNLLTVARTSAREQENLYRKLKGMARSLSFEFPPKRAMQKCPEIQKSQELEGLNLEKAYVLCSQNTNNFALQELRAEIARPEKPYNYSLRKLAETTLPVFEDLQAKLSTVGSVPKP